MIRVRIQVEDQDGQAVTLQGRITDDHGAMEVLAAKALELWRVAQEPE